MPNTVSDPQSVLKKKSVPNERMSIQTARTVEGQSTGVSILLRSFIFVSSILFLFKNAKK